MTADLRRLAARQVQFCRELASKTLAQLSSLSPGEKAAGLRQLLFVLRQHEYYPADLVEELAVLLHEIEPPA